MGGVGGGDGSAVLESGEADAPAGGHYKVRVFMRVKARDLNYTFANWEVTYLGLCPISPETAAISAGLIAFG